MDYATISQLTEEQQMQLFPFYSAERPFPLNVMTGHQFRREGYDKVTPESCGMEEAESTLDRLDVLSAFAFTADGDLLPRPDAQGATWQENRLRQWRQPRQAYRPSIPTQF